jgi:hypothetical protein
VSIPALWNTHLFDYRHYSGSIRQALARDVSATVGGGAGLDLRASGKPFNSSIDLSALRDKELLAARLAAPKWPSSLFGQIDSSRVAQGRALYTAQCARCHDGRLEGDELITTLVPLEEIGTDGNTARKLQTIVQAESVHVGSPVFDNLVSLGTGPAYEIFQTLTEQIIQYQFVSLGLTPAEREQLTEGRPNQWRAPLAYHAIPLAGIWATPPYLHNGSVLSLYELLLPPGQRTPAFRICIDTEYDPQRVGLAADARGSCVLIDTAEAGNHNTGHEYATTLDEGQRLDLLEYLKTL